MHKAYSGSQQQIESRDGQVDNTASYFFKCCWVTTIVNNKEVASVEIMVVVKPQVLKTLWYLFEEGQRGMGAWQQNFAMMSLTSTKGKLEVLQRDR